MSAAGFPACAVFSPELPQSARRPALPGYLPAVSRSAGDLGAQSTRPSNRRLSLKTDDLPVRAPRLQIAQQPPLEALS
jgi:hypothetical protein